MDNHRRRTNPTVPLDATGGTDEEEEVEEEDEVEEEEKDEKQDMYLNQPSKPASGDRSCKNLHEVLSKWEGQSQWEGPKEELTALDIHPVCLGGSLGQVREEVEKEEEKVQQDFSGDVDLFSVTLAALIGCDQEKGEETGEEVDGAFVPELQTEGSESGDHTADVQDGGRTENREEEEEQEQEEEELSEYIRHT